MENVTHSLIGVVLGEGIYRARGGPGVARRGILWASVLGSNLPDFDFLMRPFVGSGLGSLLHHRGYTHTVVASLPLALLAMGVGRWASRGKASWSTLWLAGWLGVLCHVGADFWNDYGVHPFWPFANGWLYGDFIFIMEPLFWLSLLPFAFGVARSGWARAVCAVLEVGLLGAAWSGRFMHWEVAAWLSVWALGWLGFFVLRGGARDRSVGYALGAIGAVLLMFATGSALVRERARGLLPASEELVQLSTTPSPGNPLCWRVIMSSRLTPEGRARSAALSAAGASAPSASSAPSLAGSSARASRARLQDEVRLDLDFFERVGVFTVQPFGVSMAADDPERCQFRMPGGVAGNDALVPTPTGGPWLGEFKGSLIGFNLMRQNHCRVDSLLRFVRMPFWKIGQDGQLVVGDLRYHWGGGLGFADILSRAGEECYPHDPPWGAPSGL